MATITHEPVEQAVDELTRLSGDEESRRAASVRERALINGRSELNAAERRGRQAAHTEAALKMIEAKRFNDATVAELSGLSEEEVRRLRAQD
ncbi:hypothetical protein [Thauera linaloolentis]|uniref:Uncharacterized protein n=1 Tax=Thauera linaloolentis (strain DSM 12138 / JCM 21573 / CCUG 41526 / CIP 105981 / IAM 15112 / NBRC 102519 / 47Lol) TaxID=1123367 RepID=N6YGM8_THAL4|nr:hypothetical protein [Thauera linaloolentis]ENO90665.1 hypothetical protein C666_00525 [Thauera linaloolentis 47Lol = DSM 12138]MCM8565573.1 hypothetical protein [Thauera linaloolentis]